MIDVGVVTARERASMSPAFHAVVGGAHDLHVLLRHRLLREAGGFEGFGSVHVAVDASRSCRRRRSRRCPLRRSTFTPLPVPRPDDTDSTTSRSSPTSVISSISTCMSSKTSPSVVEVIADSVVAAKHATLGLPQRSNGTHRPRTRSTSSVARSRRLNRVDCPAHDLHVLLRHRPRSIPQAQDGGEGRRGRGGHTRWWWTQRPSG